MTTTDTKLTRAEAAYAHLASFKRGDTVDVGGRSFFQPGTVTAPQKTGERPECARRIECAYLTVEGCGVETRVTVTSLLSGKHTITSRADAKAGNVRYFDAAGYAHQNPEA